MITEMPGLEGRAARLAACGRTNIGERRAASRAHTNTGASARSRRAVLPPEKRFLIFRATCIDFDERPGSAADAAVAA